MSTADLYISVDCEASGPYPGRHACLSIGAVVVKRERKAWVLGERFYAEWAPHPGAEEDPAATEIHGLSWAHLQQHGVEHRQGTRDFAQWVDAQSKKRRPFFVGLNAGFDWAFVLYALGQAGVENPFHHAPIDLKSAIWGAHGGDWLNGSNRVALARLVGKPQAPLEGGHRKHHAGDDALEQAHILIALLNLSRGFRP
jgi:DNA polymerase III epsilon subunit-like protein